MQLIVTPLDGSRSVCWATFTCKNVGNQDQTLNRVTIALRHGSNWTDSRPDFRFKHFTDVLLPPGEEFTYEYELILVGEGPYIAQPNLEIDGKWFGLTEGPTHFKVRHSAAGSHTVVTVARDGSGAFKDVQSALRSCAAHRHTTILIQAGPYLGDRSNGPLEINCDVTLIGLPERNNRGAPVIHREIVVRGGTVKIVNCSLSNVSADQSSRLTMLGCECRHVAASANSSVRISNCVVAGEGVGIRVYGQGEQVPLENGALGFDRAYEEWRNATDKGDLGSVIEAFQEMNGWMARAQIPIRYVRFASACHSTSVLIASNSNRKGRHEEKVLEQCAALLIDYTNRALANRSSEDWFEVMFLWLQIFAYRYDGNVGLFDIEAWKRLDVDPTAHIYIVVSSYRKDRARREYLQYLKIVADAYSEISDADPKTIKNYGFQILRFLRWAELKDFHDSQLKEVASLISSKAAQSARAAHGSPVAIDLQSLSIKSQALLDRSTQRRKDQDSKQLFILTGILIGIALLLGLVAVYGFERVLVVALLIGIGLVWFLKSR